MGYKLNDNLDGIQIKGLGTGREINNKLPTLYRQNWGIIAIF
jgi:hypothetical protein